MKPLEKDALDLLVAAGYMMERADSTTLTKEDLHKAGNFRFVRRRVDFGKCLEKLHQLGLMSSLFIPEEGQFEYFLTEGGEWFYNGLRTQPQYRM